QFSISSHSPTRSSYDLVSPAPGARARKTRRTQRAKTLRANELESPQAAPRKSSAHSVRSPAACRECPTGRRQCQPSSWSNDRLRSKEHTSELQSRVDLV